MSKVRIRSIGESFRRAGLGFTHEGQVFAREDLTDEQVEAIRNEPRLSVTPVDDETETDTGKVEAKGAANADAKSVAKAKGK